MHHRLYTEIPTNTHPTVEQRVLMYSNYKERFTIKLLIVITPASYVCDFERLRWKGNR